MKRARTNIVSILIACLLWVLVVAVTVLFGSDEVPAGSNAEWDGDSQGAGSDSALRQVTIGTVNYTGPHSWQGVIHIISDNVEYHEGTVTAQCTGVPQGITFEGARKNIALKNLTFNGIGDGLNIGNDQRVDGLVIENCKFVDCRSPDANAKDALIGGRGYGVFASGGKNWTIRNSVFQTLKKDSANPTRPDCSSQYAARLGGVYGLNVQSSRFENYGKASVWLMFVRAAAFDQTEFIGGPVRIGVRPNDMPGVQRGECRNIVFRNCKFTFSSVENWPASITIFPGSESIHFENCDITTVPGCEWWIEVDARETQNIQWKNCTWNGKAVEGYTGVRSSMSIDEMRQKNIAPVAEPPHDAG